MAKPNYAFQKRQRELAKKQKKEAKQQQKAALHADVPPDAEAQAAESPQPEPPATPDDKA
jgi:hypothetical protein